MPRPDTVLILVPSVHEVQIWRLPKDFVEAIRWLASYKMQDDGMNALHITGVKFEIHVTRRKETTDAAPKS